LSYGNRIEGVFLVTPPVPSESVAATSASIRGWRITPNGQILYLPSDTDEPDALGTLEQACEVLKQAGYFVNGEGRWHGEDDDAGSVVVAAGIVEHSE
jgi:hypothetical protein